MCRNMSYVAKILKFLIWQYDYFKTTQPCKGFISYETSISHWLCHSITISYTYFVFPYNWIYQMSYYQLFVRYTISIKLRILFLLLFLQTRCHIQINTFIHQCKHLIDQKLVAYVMQEVGDVVYWITPYLQYDMMKKFLHIMNCYKEIEQWSNIRYFYQ